MSASGSHGIKEDFALFQQFLLESCGILLPDDKRGQVLEKLRVLFENEDIGSVRELIELMRQPNNESLRAVVMDIITINETSWCRDTYPFDIFKDIILPDIHRKRPMDTLRIWSAACSTGQEPYSTSIILEEIQKMHPTHFVTGTHILATDISQYVLTQAQQGEYDAVVMQRGLPDAWRKLFFEELSNRCWRVKPTIKKRVEFKLFNLMHDYKTLGKFDVIFCRNVLVYFPPNIKIDILKRMHATLKPGGYLILGATEVIGGVSDKYEVIQYNPGIAYRAINQ